ncbi:MAG: zinc ribbon domain-containing protein [Clostridia bacterium]|nr:zinc ribbon domain-containing protein [Clostridia bacterium]
MMYCPKCGISLPDDATVCDACGARFDPIPDPVFDPPKSGKGKKSEKTTDVKDAFRKWVRDQGMFCLIAKAVAVTVMTVYLLIAFVSLITLIVQGYPGGTIFTDFIQKLLAGIIYGVIIWLLSDAVLYLGKLYEMKKKETKN